MSMHPAIIIRSLGWMIPVTLLAACSTQQHPTTDAPAASVSAPAAAPATTPASAPASAPAPHVPAPAEALRGIPLTLNVPSGARQTFRGLGTSLGNWGGAYQKLTPEQRAQLSRMQWKDLNFTVLKMWFNLDDYSPTPGARKLAHMREQYFDSGILTDAVANGVTTTLCAIDHFPPDMVAPGGNNWKGPMKEGEEERYATIIADGLAQIRDECGFTFTATTIQNEPDMTPAQMVRIVKTLRAALDARKLQGTQILASEASSVDWRFYGYMDALKADPEAWQALGGMSSHSYNMGSTDQAAAYVAGPDGGNLKDYWITEASDNGTEDPGMTGIPALRAASLTARFLNDVNHRATHFVHFLGFEPSGNGSDDATRIIPYTASPFSMEVLKKYHTYQRLGRAFDVGAVFRDTTSSLDGDMTWTFGLKPHLIASTARNPDGTWTVAVQNFTADSFLGMQAGGDDWNLAQSGRTPARTYRVALDIAELAGTDGVFAVHRTNATLANQEAGQVAMAKGRLEFEIAPLELVTLRSTAADGSPRP